MFHLPKNIHLFVQSCFINPYGKKHTQPHLHMQVHGQKDSECYQSNTESKRERGRAGERERARLVGLHNFTCCELRTTCTVCGCPIWFFWLFVSFFALAVVLNGFCGFFWMMFPVSVGLYPEWLPSSSSLVFGKFSASSSPLFYFCCRTDICFVLVDNAASKPYEVNEAMDMLDSGNFRNILRKNDYNMIDRGVSIIVLVLVRARHYQILLFSHFLYHLIIGSSLCLSLSVCLSVCLSLYMYSTYCSSLYP